MSDRRQLRAGDRAIWPALPLFSRRLLQDLLVQRHIGHDLLPLPIEIKRATSRSVASPKNRLQVGTSTFDPPSHRPLGILVPAGILVGRNSVPDLHHREHAT